jgi:DNA-directed RNA polymerase specialized sigma24 family protein
MPQYTVEEEIEMLADAGLLTERQAEAFVQRRIEATPGYAVAEDMGISDSSVAGYVSDAEDKIEAARDTLDVLGEIRWQAGEPPDDQ